MAHAGQEVAGDPVAKVEEPALGAARTGALFAGEGASGGMAAMVAVEQGEAVAQPAALGHCFEGLGDAGAQGAVTVAEPAVVVGEEVGAVGAQHSGQDVTQAPRRTMRRMDRRERGDVERVGGSDVCSVYVF
jgi:hypothetical protein